MGGTSRAAPDDESEEGEDEGDSDDSEHEHNEHACACTLSQSVAGVRILIDSTKHAQGEPPLDCAVGVELLRHRTQILVRQLHLSVGLVSSQAGVDLLLGRPHRPGPRRWWPRTVLVDAGGASSLDHRPCSCEGVRRSAVTCHGAPTQERQEPGERISLLT